MSGPRQNPIATYACQGPASVRRARYAGLIDLLAAAVVAMVVAPQPVIRQAIMGGHVSPQGVAVFVAALLGAILAVYWLYLAFALVSWGRTVGMYLLDLGLDAPTKPTMMEAATWAIGWTAAALPALFGLVAACDPETGWPARLSSLKTCATAPPK